MDGERTHLNVDYCNENIRKVYHELFAEALKRYNDKQTRADRRIDDYYEKIRTSKQEKQIYDEKNGLWYELRGDYYYPLLTFPEEEYRPVGVWGQRHGRYLREHKRAVYTALLTSGKLNSYLADIDQQTQDMFLQLVEQMAEREGVTEKLKAEDQMRWVGLMNNIAERAREIVNAEIIYSGTSAINVPTHTEYKEPPKIFWKY